MIMFCITHKKILKSVILLLQLFPVCSFAQYHRPNIIYIMTDDMGYGDLSCYGHKDYTTPHLDKLASQGVKFMNAYAGGPMCTPTRTSFMTGRYPARTPIGLHEPLVQKDSLVGLTPNYPSIASFMKKSGYSTHLVGKWHLGFLPAMSPIKNGFDEFFGYNSGGIDHISHTNVLGQNDLYQNETPVLKKGYLTELFAERTLHIIRRRHTKPFFICLMFSAPHWPLQAPGDSAYPLGSYD
jgi:arylsulfatase A-like enzyme